MINGFNIQLPIDCEAGAASGISDLEEGSNCVLPDRLRHICGVVVPTPNEEIQEQLRDNAPLLWEYRLFLVNEGNYDLAAVEMHTGGFEGTDDTVTELNRLTRSLGPLEQGEHILIEPLDIGILDFVLWYHFNLRFADDFQLKAWFEIGKAYALRELRHSAALKAQGYYFPLKLASEKAA